METIVLTKNCRNCQVEYPITDVDQEFYQTMKVPEPTMCPRCREQRRMCWRNERKLYRRKCDATEKDIISVFSPDKPFPVYSNEYWHSDKWEAKSYGRDFDFSRTFMEQFIELMHAVPQLSRSATGNLNSDFINQAGWNKNCYLMFEADHNQDCLYSQNIHDSMTCVDCLQCVKGELCYESINIENCYNLKYSEDCKNCSDSWFLKGCIGCKNCFGSVNLRNKEYYFFNEKLSKEEYEKRINELNLNTREGLEEMRQKFHETVLKFPHKYMHGVQNEDSTGDYLSNTQNCHECYEVRHSQDCKFLSNSLHMKKCYDITVFGAHKGCEFCYDSHEIGESVRSVYFSDQVWDGCNDIYYSKLCINNCHDLFGCVGLKRASYCILNKQYTQEEYEVLRDKIIERMKQTGEWGEFFPAHLSPFDYNETVAQDFFPITKEQAVAAGLGWREDDSKESVAQTCEVPALVKDVKDEFVKEVLACTECGKNYKITVQELRYYRQMGLPVPTKCHECRHQVRAARKAPRYLWDRKCRKCDVNITTTYSEERPEIVYCEKCYLENVD